MSKKNLTVMIVEGTPAKAGNYDADIEYKSKKFKIRYRPGQEPYLFYDQKRVPRPDTHIPKVAASFLTGLDDSSIEVDFIQVPVRRQSLELEFFKYSPQSSWNETKQLADRRFVRKKIPATNPRKHYLYSKTAMNIKAQIDHYKPDLVLTSFNLQGNSLPLTGIKERDVTFSDMVESVSLVTNTPIVAAISNTSNLNKDKAIIRNHLPAMAGGFTPDKEAPYIKVYNRVNVSDSSVYRHRGVVRTDFFNAADTLKIIWPKRRMALDFPVINPTDEPTSMNVSIGRGNSFIAPGWAGIVIGTIMKAAKNPSQQLGKSLAVKAFMIDYLKRIKSSTNIRNDKDLERTLISLERRVVDSYNKLAENREIKAVKEGTTKDKIDQFFNMK